MNPLLTQWIGTVVRSFLLVTVGGYLVEHGLLTQVEADEQMTVLAAALVTAGTIAWSLWQKYHSQRKANTTLAVMNALSPDQPNITQRDIEAVMQRGNSAPATVSRYDAPPLKGDGDGFNRLADAVERS